MKIWNVAAGLFGLCLLAGSHGALADTLRGNYPTCRDPLDFKKAELAAQRQEWVEFLHMKCGLFAYRGTTVRVVRCDADLTPAELRGITGPVPLDGSLPSGVCEVEVAESDGSTGTYYAHSLDIEKPRPVTSSGAVVADELTGDFFTCRIADQVKMVRDALRRGDILARISIGCGLDDIGTPVRVIRCATNVISEEMERFSRPVPQDKNLPDFVCEVEVFYQRRAIGIYYTYFYNIQKAP